MLKEGQATPVTITPSLPYVLNSPEFKKRKTKRGAFSTEAYYVKINNNINMQTKQTSI